MRQVMPHCNNMVDDLRPCKSFLHLKSGGGASILAPSGCGRSAEGRRFPSAAQCSQELAAGRSNKLEDAAAWQIAVIRSGVAPLGKRLNISRPSIWVEGSVHEAIIRTPSFVIYIAKTRTACYLYWR